MVSLINLYLLSWVILVYVINGNTSLTLPELIQNDGYPFEVHEVLTTDGYYLSAFRIFPSKRVESQQAPVLIVHGLTGSAADFVLKGPGNSLAYLLSDEGFDVWLLSCRGTIYSEKHVKLNTADPEFWNYSWHEMGVYDLPNTIDYILQVTDFDKLQHIGLSQGATAFYVMLSERPEYNSKILSHVAYAPAVFLCQISNALMVAAALPEYFGWFSDFFEQNGNFNLTPQIPFFLNIAKALCNCNGDICPVCKHIAFSLLDIQRFQNSSYMFLLKLMNLYPAGASTKSFIHYAQSINTCEFRPFHLPGSVIPKKYNLTNIRSPAFVFYGENDNIQNSKDTFFFGSQLPNGFADTIIVKDFGHADFVIAYDAKEKVYERTIEILKRMLE